MDVRKRVLLVEDDPALRRATARELRREFDVVSVADYDAAFIEMGGGLDAVVSDFDLGPGRNGLQVLSAALARVPQAARILVSATLLMPAVDAALVKGVAHMFVPKPWKQDELVSVVRRYIGKIGLAGQARSGTRRIDGAEDVAPARGVKRKP